MTRLGKSWLCAVALAGSAIAAMPALADVREGVEAWSRGDYAGAVSEWEGPAAAGDPDAMFNLAQAYRLGRGTARDTGRAELLYRQAAEAGHVQAADTYGLMLFQDGRRADALPYVRDAARRGDPRSQYLLGIAHFNGDLVDRDWVRAYALVTLAGSAGLPQAVPAIARMDEFIPLAQRQRAADLAGELRAEADAARTVELAAADLGMQASEAAPRVPRPIATTAVSPSVAAARTAIEEARRATGTASPAEAGAQHAAAPVQPRVAGQRPAAVPPPATMAVAAPPTPPPAATAAPAREQAPERPAGPWRVQLGAFGVQGNAERLWNRLASRAELAGRERLLVPAGRVTKLQAGGYATQAEAERACNSLKRAGQDCLVTRS